MTNTPQDSTISDEEIQELLDQMPQQQAINHSVLRVWQAVLSNIDVEAAARPSMDFCARIIRHYPHLAFQEISEYVDRYYEILKKARDILTEVIESDPEAFSRSGKADVELNKGNYVKVIAGWEGLLRTMTDAWDSDSDWSHVDMPAISDATVFLMSDKGLLGQLAALGFQFDEEDAETVEKLIQEHAQAEEG